MDVCRWVFVNVQVMNPWDVFWISIPQQKADICLNTIIMPFKHMYATIETVISYVGVFCEIHMERPKVGYTLLMINNA